MAEINRLTSDEDLRQELWLSFLEGDGSFLLYRRNILNKDLYSLWHLKENLRQMKRPD